MVLDFTLSQRFPIFTLFQVIIQFAIVVLGIKAWFYFEKKLFWLYLSAGFFLMFLRRLIVFISVLAGAHYCEVIKYGYIIHTIENLAFPMIMSGLFLAAMIKIHRSHKKYLSEFNSLSEENKDMKKVLEKLNLESHKIDKMLMKRKG